MLRITIELVPQGIETAKHSIAKGEIINTGEGDWDTGKYVYTFCSPASKVKREAVSLSGRVEGFDRGRGSLELLYECLKDAFEG